MVPFFTLLPLLLLLSLLTAEGWKALIGLCLGSVGIVVIALLAKHKLYTDSQHVGSELKIKDRLIMK